MKRSKKDLLRRAVIARKLKRLVRRPGFAPQDSRDAIQSKLVQGLLGEEMSEDEAREIALENHPDLKEMELAGTLPDRMLDENDGVWSPRMHIAMHTVIERQLACNEPAGIVELAIKFEGEGKLCAHEIKHVIAAALVEQIWAMQHTQVAFDEEQYFVDIEAAYIQALVRSD